jgi:hypothetical protein
MESPAAFDPDEEVYKKNNVIPASKIPQIDKEETVVVENKTGRNATYLAGMRKELDPAKLENPVTITAGGTYHDKFVDKIAKGLPTGKNVVISQEALEYLAKFAKRMKDGYQAAVPLLCCGTDCVYAKSCPLLKAGIEVELMEPCKVEEHLFNTWVEDKMVELDVDPDDPMASIDRSQIREYAELEILQMRATLEMANDPLTVREKVIGMSEDGEPLTQDIENPRIAIVGRLSQAKRGLLGDLVGTRKERLKAGPKGEDTADTVAAFAAGARKRNEELEKKRLESKTNEKEVIVVEVKDVTPPKD